MASRSRVEFDERESYYSDRGGPRRTREETFERRESHERRTPSRGPPPARVREREVDEVDVRIRERDRESRVPAFMREDGRRTDAGPLVLRQREVETVERPRQRRSPSPVRVRETRIIERERSISPPPVRRRVEEDVRVRTIERDRIRAPSRGPSLERIRTRVVERERSVSPPSSPEVVERVRTRIIERERSVSPPPARVERVQARYVERGRSPSPFEEEHERIRIVERERRRIPSPSPSPSPPPPIIKGPVIEREVITHYTDIDHGVIVAPRPPSPPPPRVRPKERDTEIDIYTSHNTTEVDIHKSTRHGSASRERRPAPRAEKVRGDELVVASSRDRLEVDIQERHTHRRRSRSAVPTADYADESEYITDRIESRGRMGEAYNGATKDWAIVDVPPGTERVRMDGVGGASAEVTWQRYNGVRRAKFIPERERERESIVSSSTTISDRELQVRERPAEARESRLSVQVYDKHRDHEIDVDVEKVTDRRISLRPQPPPQRKAPDTWTEITKDLILREAIEELGYQYEETEFFFYVMQYLRYEEVLELVQLSDQIRQARKDRAYEVQWERDYRSQWQQQRDSRPQHRHRHRHHHSRSTDRWEEDKVVEREREVYVDHRGAVRSYR